jgi:hypothetical protein
MNTLSKAFDKTAVRKNEPSKREIRQFIEAAGTGDMSVVTSFVVRYPHYMDASAGCGRNALMKAVENGRKEAVMLLTLVSVGMASIATTASAAKLHDIEAAAREITGLPPSVNPAVIIPAPGMKLEM